MVSNIESENCDKIEVTLTEDVLKKTCYWIIFKFLIDPYHKQQNSSRADLIGGFIDRWLNRIPETIIFDKMLAENGMGDIHVINDTFLYTDSISKNAPDILGLYKEDENHNKTYYPFVKFDNGKWYIEEEINPPFLEMKTFRKSQSLVTIPENQFENDHYYAIVESDINDIYLISLFDENFISENYYNEIFNNPSIYEVFVGNDEGKQLKFPKDYVNDKLGIGILTPNDFLKEEIGSLGKYTLLGIYKGSTISKYSIIAGTRKKIKDKPLYLSKIEPYNDTIKKCFKESCMKWEYFTQIKCIPVFIDSNFSKITIVNETLENELFIYIDGNATINNEPFSNTFCRLKFKHKIIDAIKYFYLWDVKECDKRPVFRNEKELPQTWLIYKHYGEEKSVTSLNISLGENSYLEIIENNKENNIFKVSGEVKFDETKYTSGCYKISFDNDEGIYKFNSKMGSIKSLEDKGNNNYKISFPNGSDKFKEELPIFDPICIKIHENSSLNIIQMTKKIVQVIAIGNVDIKNNIKTFCLKDNSYQLDFGYDTIEGVQHYNLKKCQKIETSETIKKLIEKLEKSDNKDLIRNGLNYPVTYKKKNNESKQNDYDILYILEDNSVFIKGDKHDLDSDEKDIEGVSFYKDIYANCIYKIRNVPFDVKFWDDSSYIEILKKGKTSLIRVNGEACINDYKIHNKNNKINTGVYKLFFEKFDRSSDNDELIFSKSIIPNDEICKKEILEKFDRIVN